MSNKRMIWLCRNLSTLLDAGVPVTRALSVLTSQAPAGRIRQALQRVAADVDAGATLAEAFEARGLFPGLFVLLVGVGEESGALERALAELVRFYEFQQRIRQTLIANLALPVIQYVVAVAVISLATHIITRAAPSSICAPAMAALSRPSGSTSSWSSPLPAAGRVTRCSWACRRWAT